MKCLNCGVNYDDGDRECPICGTRAGHGRRAKTPRYTGYGHTRHDAQSCTHRTFTKDETFTGPGKTKPMRDKNPQDAAARMKKWGVGAVVVLALLFELLPAGIRFVQEQIAEWRFQAAWQQVAPEPADDWDSGGEADAPYLIVSAADVLGARSVAATADGGVLTIALDGEDQYSLTYETGDGLQYQEDGWAWCAYNEPSEALYDDAYPPETHDSYTICLDIDAATAPGALPEALAAHTDSGEMWLLAYVPADGGATVLDDAYGECAAFFGGERFVTLSEIAQG